MLPISALLLHEIFPSGPWMLVLLGLVFLVGVAFGLAGVYICRQHGPAALAMSTVGFCLALFVLLTTLDRSYGEAIAFPIMGGFAQALVIGFRTRRGGGGATLLEGLIGGGAFVGGVIAAVIGAAIIANA